ncbi:phosphorylase family protein [Geomesophilobacter sediminis]|uniref:Nucleoside phosphorylase n=1 Tax=Geomesophilobacter sediminis TaxID=2798584 RepID=A0A8J7J4Q3_9BACT|nr:nucleoside phosphorylase [Geomesophilobacter sediminis]MBJ6725923.1 nucleoside phosphorylase [Geomesophilobacter sediminis]
MKNQTIGVIAAMPEEIAPFLKRVGTYRKESCGGCKLYRFSLGETRIVLVESGMGPARAAAAARVLLQEATPRLVVNYGLGGGVRPGISVGDLVLAQRVVWLEGNAFRQAAAPDREISDRLAGHAAAAGQPMARGTFVTAAAITSKERVSALLPPAEPHPVLEMETAAILEVAAEAGVPVIALRGISDAGDEELGFSLDEFTDAEFNIKISRVLATVAQRPRIIPQLIRLAGNSRRAAENLARLLETALPAL